MKLEQIENLLLQEMEEVKGGAGGSCSCHTGAGQSSVPEPDGFCECHSGAAQVVKKEGTENPEEEEDETPTRQP